jgi:hypothetical protein
MAIFKETIITTETTTVTKSRQFHVDTVPSPNTPAAPTSTAEIIASDVSLSNPLFLGTAMAILAFTSCLAHEALGANISCRREFVALVVKMFFARF